MGQALASQPNPQERLLFHHKTLDAYQIGLNLIEWFVSLPGAKDLSDRSLRQVDQATTSIVLNIAEGNGRYAELDHYRFLDIANASNVKAAAYLDLCVHKRVIPESTVAPAKAILSRIDLMLSRM